ncbi:hypothetical protein CsSME_00015694 [Camellia sinensis var. sinensis]
MESYLQLQALTVLGLVFIVVCLNMIMAKSKLHKKRNRTPPEPAGAWPLIGHLRLLGANKLLHRTLGAMADNYGPAFSIRLGIKQALVVSSWEVAKECFTTNDKIFSTRPKSLALKLMAYDHAVLGFAPYGPYWRDLRKLAMIELLSSHRLEILKHVRDSEVNFFMKEVYEQWVGKGSRKPVLVEMKEKFGDVVMKIMLRIVNKNYRHVGNSRSSKEESRRCQKALGDFMHLVGLLLISDAIPFLGWFDVLNGYRGKMKRSAREVDDVLGSWVEEHQRKRVAGSIDEGEQDFIDVLMSAMEESQLSHGHDTDTVIKATCLMDKASIIKDAIDYIQELHEQEKRIQADLIQLESGKLKKNAVFDLDQEIPTLSRLNKKGIDHSYDSRRSTTSSIEDLEYGPLIFLKVLGIFA